MYTTCHKAISISSFCSVIYAKHYKLFSQNFFVFTLVRIFHLFVHQILVFIIENIHRHKIYSQLSSALKNICISHAQLLHKYALVVHSKLHNCSPNLRYC